VTALSVRKPDSRHLGLAAVILIGVVARLWYYSHGVHFSAAPLGFYMQFLDPELLRHDLARSLFYLRDQPPLFNAFLGVILKLFPNRYAVAFGAIYLVSGLLFGLILYQLMVRLRVAPWWAAVVTILFVDGPIAILYENWLFYTFPLAVLLCASALFLHRFLESHRFLDASIFFWLLATVVLARGIFHPLWLLLVALGLILFERGHRRQVALAALGPLLIVAALLVKQALVFHALFWGRTIQQMNLAVMTSMRLPVTLRDRLLHERKLVISSAHIDSGPDGYVYFVEPQPPTGIPALDLKYKQGTRFPNYNHSSYVAVGVLYGRDALYVLRNYPAVYVEAVRENFERYALPSDQADPFNTKKYENRLAIQSLLTEYNFWFAWQRSPDQIPPLHIVGFPVLIIFGLIAFIRGVRRARLMARPEASRERAHALTLAFALYTTLWVSAVTLLFSYSDQNRYRFKVSAFYCLFLALLGQRTFAWAARGVHRFRARSAQRATK
jgi:hypothetical protein